MTTLASCLITFGLALLLIMAARNARRADDLENDMAQLREEIALANGRIHQRIEELEERE